jgi:hypothetical protein
VNTQREGENINNKENKEYRETFKETLVAPSQQTEQNKQQQQQQQQQKR